MKKIALSFFIMNFSLALTVASAADECPALNTENTLQEIIEIGLCRNPTTKISYLSMEAARLNKNAAYADYLPNVTGSISASTSDRGQDLGDEWGTGASISARYLIFDFGRRYSELSRLESVWKATGFDHVDQTQSYVYSVIGAYYGLLIADADVATNKQLFSVATEAKNTASTKYKAGAVAKADVLRAETNLAMKKTDLQRAENAREIAVGRLAMLLSLPQNTGIKIKDMPAEFGGSAEIKDVQELIEVAEKKRPDLQSAAASTDAARQSRNMALMRFMPTITANGSMSYNLDTDTRETTLGISASMPIFTGFSNIYSARAAMLNYERAQEQEKSRQDNARLDVWTAFNNYKTAHDVLESTNALLKSATETERVVAGMYKVGRSTMLDWQTAQGDLASAKRQNASARYDLFIKRAALAMSVGELGGTP